MLHARIIERKAALFRDYFTALHKRIFPVGDRVHSASGGNISAGNRLRRQAGTNSFRTGQSAIEKAFELIVSADECPVGNQIRQSTNSRSGN